MKKVRAIILRTAGTNCDRETAFAFEKAGAESNLLHINSLAKEGRSLDKYQILAIPGGFTYGDDVASGKILANEIRFLLRESIEQFVSEGKLIIGICNGFQVLVKMGLLPGLKGKGLFSNDATLTLNDSGKFEDRWVNLKSDTVARNKCVWTKGMDPIIQVPVAHAEGKFQSKDKDVLNALKKNDQVVFRYVDDRGKRTGYPFNPNGSIDGIAGICDKSGRILGMMPHPERHISFLQHPNWRRSGPGASGMGVGIGLFLNGVEYAGKNLLS